MTYALGAALSAHGISARLVSFLYVPVDGTELNGHTVVEFRDEDGQWIMVDAASGVVWQTIDGR